MSGWLQLDIKNEKVWASNEKHVYYVTRLKPTNIFWRVFEEDIRA